MRGILRKNSFFSSGSEAHLPDASFSLVAGGYSGASSAHTWEWAAASTCCSCCCATTSIALLARHAWSSCCRQDTLTTRIMDRVQAVLLQSFNSQSLTSAWCNGGCLYVSHLVAGILNISINLILMTAEKVQFTNSLQWCDSLSLPLCCKAVNESRVSH